MQKCPTCGTKLDIIRIETILTHRQRMIRDAIEPAKREIVSSSIRSEELFAYLDSCVDGWRWSLRTLQSELKILASMEIVWHPGGRKEGWDIKPDNIILIPASATRNAA